ncbi:uncharacterized protein LOC100826884 [Brachypodium distachyon]|uniref:uncharacterized protein LOC100826884 n=1 Tax=Brachypodium distachyon TaxID=15368 RepID=UPI00071D376E|nr:uncharacterized protein LOC100826884 [Brachypodium distachyon]|eukprot:XP_014756562.1 uncharacterized protein LOC100826884 [Brachypodium distachyon]
MEVTQISKLEVISLLIETLCPETIHFAMKNQGKANDFISQLEVVANTSMTSKTMMDDCSLLQFGETGTKELLIVIDAAVPAGSYDHLGFFTIILVGPEEKALLDPKIKEASALTYVYFKGVRTGNRTAHAGQTKATGNAKTGQKKATGNVAGQKKATGNVAGQKKAAGNAYAGQKKKRYTSLTLKDDSGI